LREARAGRYKKNQIELSKMIKLNEERREQHELEMILEEERRAEEAMMLLELESIQRM